MKKFNFNLIAVFSIFVLVFNFSMSKAEETTVTIDPSPAPVEEPAAETPAAEPIVSVTEPESTPEINVEAPAEPVPSIEVVMPEETADAVSLPPAETAAAELTPPASVSAEPIIFDFSQPAETTTPEIADAYGANDSAVSGGGSEQHEVLTGIIRGADINELTILAQWQMSDETADGKYSGTDNSADTGAQFLPSGQFEIDKPVVVCALAADVNGPADINSVAAAINYPLASSECGAQKSRFNLEKVELEAAAGLVCDKLRNNNNNLLAWGSDKIDNLVYGYEHICGQDGFLINGAAALYCAQSPLAFSDPAGDYTVEINAKNNAGQEVRGENSFKYLELTTFETDFSEILYGPVKLNQPKDLTGDLNWGNAASPTIRNAGNTRLKIKIWQNDFGLGKTNGVWNLNYQARVGSSTGFMSYEPEQATLLNNILELGQTAAMDFSVLIHGFPESGDSAYWGKMLLSADKAEPLSCEN